MFLGSSFSPNSVNVMWLFYFKDLFIYFREKTGEGRWREFQGDSPLSEEPNSELHLRTHEIMTWGKTKGWMLNWLGHRGAPVRWRSMYC